MAQLKLRYKLWVRVKVLDIFAEQSPVAHGFEIWCQVGRELALDD